MDNTLPDSPIKLKRGYLITCAHCGQRKQVDGARRKYCTPECVYAHRLATRDERFWARIDRSGGPDSCWEWTALRTPGGYGRFVYTEEGRQRFTGAHRYALQVSLGIELSADQFACHRCDNPPCCNPAHLFVGSVADNTQDAWRKGRLRKRGTQATYASGETHGRSKLSREQVLEIVRLYGAAERSLSDLATHYGVVPKAIHSIVRGRTWSRVTGITPETAKWKRRGVGGCPKAGLILSDADVEEARRLIGEGWTLRGLGRLFGCHPRSVARRLNRRDPSGESA